MSWLREYDSLTYNEGYRQIPLPIVKKINNCLFYLLISYLEHITDFIKVPFWEYVKGKRSFHVISYCVINVALLVLTPTYKVRYTRADTYV